MGLDASSKAQVACWQNTFITSLMAGRSCGAIPSLLSDGTLNRYFNADKQKRKDVRQREPEPVSKKKKMNVKDT